MRHAARSERAAPLGKYAFASPVFVPMLMTGAHTGRLPPGRQLHERDHAGDPYLVIIMVVLRRYMPRAGIGTILALMLPYCLAILVSWTALLQLWIWLDVPLGPAGPLHYPNR
jgi:aminobenzoyl-glutamate transport protein